jgi:hypothetical protein
MQGEMCRWFVLLGRPGGDVGQRGRSVGHTSTPGRATAGALIRERSPPQASLFPSVEGDSDGHPVGEAEGIAASNGRRQEQQRFLAVRRPMQQVHAVGA